MMVLFILKRFIGVFAIIKDCDLIINYSETRL